jgi:hypothetical protein
MARKCIHRWHTIVIRRKIQSELADTTASNCNEVETVVDRNYFVASYDRSLNNK